MTKQEYRAQLIKLRKQETEKDIKSAKIAKEVLSFCESYSVIGVYLSKEDEVQTDELIKELQAQNKVVVFPKVEGNDLEFYKSDKFEISSFGVREPIEGEKYSKDKIDVMIVPGVGFDISRNRLGFGKGYYDRYLSDYCGKKIGICFSSQVVMNLPITCKDIQMDILITDKMVL